METEETRLNSDVNRKVIQIFSHFMARITKFEELTAAGNTFLVSFQQGLEFIRKPSIEKTSRLFEKIIKANETSRLQSYIKAGCVNTSKRIENINKLHTSHTELLNNLSKAKNIIDELKGLVEDLNLAMEALNESLQDLHHKEDDSNSDPLAATYGQDEMVSSFYEKPEIVDYAAIVAIIYSMVKQDYVMQEKIVLSLSIKTSSGELESYCLMWSLRPYVNDEIMHQAWTLTP